MDKMEQKMHKFPEIKQFRHAIQEVTHRARYRGDAENGEPIYEDCELPELSYRGSVKLHGTNAAIVYTWNPLTFNYEVHAQSRGNIITPTNDNAGFASFVHTTNVEFILGEIMKVENDLGYTPEVVKVYGEWCGGNIQKGVAINGLGKMFVIFAIKIDKTWMLDESLSNVKNIEQSIYNIYDYPTYEINIDFNNPKISAQKMTEMVDGVEKECPVGKAFGNDGIGEGIVFKCITEGWESSRYWFKVKGDKHKSSGTKEKVPVDMERVNSMNELVDYLVTESRLLQGFDYLREEGLEFSRKSTADYLRWVYNDIVKEELDTIVGNGFEPKEISGTISNKARGWFFTKLDEGIGL
jgi:hypothetical protein